MAHKIFNLLHVPKIYISYQNITNYLHTEAHKHGKLFLVHMCHYNFHSVFSNSRQAWYKLIDQFSLRAVCLSWSPTIRKHMEQCLGWGSVSTIMASWGNCGTCRKQGTSVVPKQLSTDRLSISGPLKSRTAVLSFHNFHVVVMCLVAILLLAFCNLSNKWHTAGKINTLLLVSSWVYIPLFWYFCWILAF